MQDIQKHKIPYTHMIDKIKHGGYFYVFVGVVGDVESNFCSLVSVQ